MLVTATRIVDEAGVVLWEGDPVLVDEARPVVLCVTDRVVDEPAERRALAERTGADAVDMESGKLAASGRLAGAVRAISDTPVAPVGTLARAAHSDGTTDWRVVLRAFATEPLRSARTARAAQRGFASLERAARRLR